VSGFKNKAEMQTCIDQLNADCEAWTTELREVRARMVTLEEALAFESDRAARHHRNADEWARKYRAYGSELDYWKQHARRIWGRWHLSVRVELTPWSWSLRPQFPRRGNLSIGILQFRWLFLCVEAIDA
jgi:hypothetical protein